MVSYLRCVGVRIYSDKFRWLGLIMEINLVAELRESVEVVTGGHNERRN